MKPILLLFFLFCFYKPFAQKDSIYSPETFEEMFLQMDRVLNPAQIKQIKELAEDSILRTLPYISDLTKGYKYYNEAKIIKELEEKGLNYIERYLLIVLSYHRYLNGINPKLPEQYQYYDSLHIGQRKRFSELQKRDSVDGKYIPTNLVDCFIELDKLLSSKDKRYISRKKTLGLHMTLGLFIRNRWQLWGGSRLQKYFFDLNGKMMHPDYMSSIILQQYKLWLIGNKTAWREWEIKIKKSS
jgi:hypothetical protein